MIYNEPSVGETRKSRKAACDVSAQRNLRAAPSGRMPTTEVTTHSWTFNPLVYFTSFIHSFIHVCNSSCMASLSHCKTRVEYDRSLLSKHFHLVSCRCLRVWWGREGPFPFKPSIMLHYHTGFCHWPSFDSLNLYNANAQIALSVCPETHVILKEKVHSVKNNYCLVAYKVGREVGWLGYSWKKTRLSYGQQ